MEEFSLTLEDFRACEWPTVIGSATSQECVTYSEVFRTKAEDARAKGNERARRVFELLRDICSFGFEPSRFADPFPPMMTLGNRRTATPVDIAESDLGLLGSLALEIEDPELKARVADLVWVTKRDHHCAELAIDAYLGSASRLESGPVFQFSVQRLERALRLAVLLSSKPLFEKVVKEIEQVIERQQANELLRCAYLMELLMEFRAGEAPAQALRTRASAEEASAANDFDAARHLWLLAAGWFKQARDEPNRKAAMIAAAETHVSQAGIFERGNPPNYSLVCHHLGMAIDAHKRIGGQKARIDDLYARLRVAQPYAVDQMKTIASEPMKFDPEPAIALVRGKSLHEALKAVAASYRPVEVQALRQTVERDAQATPLIHSLPAMIMSASGKVVARRSSMLSADAKERDEATQDWMFQQGHFIRAARAMGHLAPAVRQIAQEHFVQQSDFERIVRDNFFVPAGRERIFARGLHAGLTGDLLVASHLLIPQLENSFRAVLDRNGVTTSKIDNGVEREMYIQELLYLPDFLRVFGEDLAFELRGLLIEQVSSNLRHSLSHGLFDYEVFESSEVLYIWWVVLWLCFIQELQANKPTS